MPIPPIMSRCTATADCRKSQKQKKEAMLPCQHGVDEGEHRFFDSETGKENQLSADNTLISVMADLKKPIALRIGLILRWLMSISQFSV